MDFLNSHGSTTSNHQHCQPDQAIPVGVIPDIPLPANEYTQNWIERFSQLSLADSGVDRLPNRVTRKLGVIGARLARRVCQTSIGRAQRFIADIIRPATIDTANDLIASIQKGRIETVIAIWHREKVGYLSNWVNN